MKLIQKKNLFSHNKNLIQFLDYFNFIFDEESHWYSLGGVCNEVKLKCSSNKFSAINTNDDKKNSRPEDLNLEKWRFETQLYSSARIPIIATSTRSKV